MTSLFSQLLVVGSLMYAAASDCSDSSLSIYVTEEGNIRARFATAEMLSDDGSIHTICGLKCACFDKIFLCCSDTDCIHMDHECPAGSHNPYSPPVPLTDIGRAFIVNPSNSVLLQEQPEVDFQQLHVIQDSGSDSLHLQPHLGPDMNGNDAALPFVVHDVPVPVVVHDNPSSVVLQDDTAPVIVHENPDEAQHLGNADSGLLSNSLQDTKSDGLDQGSGFIHNLHPVKKRSTKLMDLLMRNRANRAKRHASFMEDAFTTMEATTMQGTTYTEESEYSSTESVDFTTNLATTEEEEQEEEEETSEFQDKSSKVEMDSQRKKRAVLEPIFISTEMATTEYSENYVEVTESPISTTTTFYKK